MAKSPSKPEISSSDRLRRLYPETDIGSESFPLAGSFVFKTPPRKMNMQPTSATRRFFNMVIDYWIFPVIVTFFLAFMMSLGLINYIDFQPLIIIISFLQVIVFEQLFGQSVGKMITRTKVVTENGDKPSFGQIIVRNLARLIPFEAFSLLAKNPVGWHDSLSKTVVVNKNQNKTTPVDNEKVISKKENKKIPLATIAFISIPVIIFGLSQYLNWKVKNDVNQQVVELMHDKVELTRQKESENQGATERLVDVLLPFEWEKRETTGKNMVFSASDGESIITIHKIKIDENVSFQDLNREEKALYADQIFKEAKNEFEGVELIDSGFKKTIFYDEVFFMIYKRTINGSETVNIVNQIFDEELYTLTAITSESNFSENKSQLERILDSFRLI